MRKSELRQERGIQVLKEEVVPGIGREGKKLVVFAEIGGREYKVFAHFTRSKDLANISVARELAEILYKKSGFPTNYSYRY